MSQIGWGISRASSTYFLSSKAKVGNFSKKKGSPMPVPALTSHLLIDSILDKKYFSFHFHINS